MHALHIESGLYVTFIQIRNNKLIKNVINIMNTKYIKNWIKLKIKCAFLYNF